MFPRSRKLISKISENKGPPKISEKLYFLDLGISQTRSRNFLDTPGNIGQRTHQIVQGTGVKRVAPTTVQYWARDLASDHQYH